MAWLLVAVLAIAAARVADGARDARSLNEEPAPAPAPAPASLIQTSARMKGRPVQYGEMTGMDDCYPTLSGGASNPDYNNCEDTKANNKAETRQIVDDEKLVERVNVAEENEVASAYNAEATTTNSEMSGQYQVMAGDNNYEHATMKNVQTSVYTQANKIIEPARTLFGSVESEYTETDEDISAAEQNHDSAVGARDGKFYTKANQQDAKALAHTESDKAFYPEEVGDVEKDADDWTTTTEKDVGERGVKVNEVDVERSESVTQSTAAIADIDANIEQLQLDVQEDQIDHANRGDELINGNGDGGGLYNSTSSTPSTATGSDVFTGENEPGSFVPSLATVMEGGDVMAENFEEEEEGRLDNFTLAQEDANEEMETNLEEQALSGDTKHDETLEEADDSIDKFVEDMEQKVDTYETDMTNRYTYNHDKGVSTSDTVEAVVEYLQATVAAIEGTETRLAPEADALLMNAQTALAKAVGLSKEDVEKNGDALGANIYATLKTQMAAIAAANAELIANGTASVDDLAGHSSSFTKYTMGTSTAGIDCAATPWICKTTVKQIEAQLKTDTETSVKMGEEINALKATVNKARQYPTEAAELEQNVKTEEDAVAEGLTSYASDKAQDVTTEEAKKGKQVTESETVAREQVVKTREELSNEINELVESALASTEKIAADAFRKTSELKGEVNEENTASYEAMTTFMKNLETLKELKVSSGSDTTKYVDMAREVNSEATNLIGQLTEPLKVALSDARSENVQAMEVVEADLEKKIDQQQGLAREQLQEVLHKVTAASKREWTTRNARIAEEKDLQHNVSSRDLESKQVAQHADAVFAEISTVVDKSVSTLDAILAAVQEQLKQQAASADASVAADAARLAAEADELLHKYKEDMSTIIGDYNDAILDGDARLDQELDENAQTDYAAEAQAAKSLRDEAAAVQSLEHAAGGQVSTAAVQTVDEAKAVVDASSQAAADATAAAHNEATAVGADVNNEMLNADTEGQAQIKQSTDKVDAQLQKDESEFNAEASKVSGQLSNATEFDQTTGANADDAIDSESEAAKAEGDKEGQEAADTEAAIHNAEEKTEEQEREEQAQLDREAAEAAEEAAKAPKDTAATLANMEEAEQIVDGEVGAVKQEEANRMKALDPSDRLRAIQTDLNHIKTSLDSQSTLVTTELNSADASSENLLKQATLQLPDIRKSLQTLQPAVLAREKALPVVMEHMRQQMASTFALLDSRMNEVTNNADGVRDRIEGKLDELKKKFKDTEGKLVEMLEMTSYQSEDAMNRVAKVVNEGLAEDTALNAEVNDNVRPKTAEYRGKMQKVFDLLGMEVDEEAIMRRANQTMANEMALRERLSGSGADLEAAVAALNAATKANLDKHFAEMAMEIAAVMHDQSLSEAQKLAKIRQLKEEGRAKSDEIAGKMGNLVSSQYHELHALDEKSLSAQGLAARAEALSKGDPSSITAGKMKMLQEETYNKVHDLRRYISYANNGPGGESLLETHESSKTFEQARNRVAHDANMRTQAQAESDAANFRAEEAALRALHAKTEHKAEGWLQSLQVITGA